MRRNLKIISFIAVLLCASIFIGTVAIAAESPNIDNIKEEGYNQFEIQEQSADEYNIWDKMIDFLISLIWGAETSTDANDDTVKLRSPFFFAFFRESPSFGGKIKYIRWIGHKFKILSYSGKYAYVQDTANNEKGYIYSAFLKKKSSSTSLNIRREYEHIYVDVIKTGRIVVDYNGSGTISWSLSEEGIIYFNKNDLSIRGLKPGTVKLTARVGLASDSITITCLNDWAETETSTTTKTIIMRKHPGALYGSNATISSGTKVTAHGDLADGSGWIYVEANNNWGFIQLSDFPGIDYLMTEYHYYDKGYDLRFGSAKTKILSYASVLNDVMMKNFKLKVSSYVKPYTSAADNCKILHYGKVAKDNLASSCPKTSEHNSSSCLTTKYLRKEIGSSNRKGLVTNIVWTGHILDGNARSNSTVGLGSIVMTPYGSVKEASGYPNDSDTDIREDRVYTLVHETGHQFGVYDHYCKGDISEITNRCSNNYCSKCNGETIPKGCIMYERINLENTDISDLYCDDCRKNILNYIKNF